MPHRGGLPLECQCRFSMPSDRYAAKRAQSRHVARAGEHGKIEKGRARQDRREFLAAFPRARFRDAVPWAYALRVRDCPCCTGGRRSGSPLGRKSCVVRLLRGRHQLPDDVDEVPSCRSPGGWELTSIPACLPDRSPQVGRCLRHAYRGVVRSTSPGGTRRATLSKSQTRSLRLQAIQVGQNKATQQTCEDHGKYSVAIARIV